MKINYKKPVFVYRNLKHGRKSRPLYSVMQAGRVIRRTHRIMLKDVSFIVRKAGRLKVLETGRKNVHAFAKGYITGSAFGTDKSGRLAQVICYNPYNDDVFFTLDGPVTSARAVILNEGGMTGAYFD